MYPCIYIVCTLDIINSKQCMKLTVDVVDIGTGRRASKFFPLLTSPPLVLWMGGALADVPGNGDWGYKTFFFRMAFSNIPICLDN